MLKYYISLTKTDIKIDKITKKTKINEINY